MKSSAEGAEEVLAGIGTAVAQKLTYMDEKDLKELVEDQDLLEQFVVGAVTSGISQSGLLPGTKSGSFIEANKNGTDFITGYTPAEQATIDKVVAERVAEQQKNGSRLSRKEIGKIEESVKASFDRGEIAEPTAESVQMLLEPLSAQQTTNGMSNNVSGLNGVNTNTSSQSQKVGKATTIKNPYAGLKPIQTKNQFPRIEIEQKKYDDTITSIHTAKIDKSLNSDNGIKTVIQKVYETLFGENGEAFHIPVEDMTFDGSSYVIDVNKSSVGKLVKDGPISVEKMCVLNDIVNVLANAEYLGSANYDNYNKKNSGVIRYDYFETPVRINGEDYIVTFDVEVQKGSNRYRMHRVINEMNLAKATDKVEFPAASEVRANDVNTAHKTGASLGLLGSSNDIISNSAENVKNVVPDLANADTFNRYASTENIQSDNQRVRSYNTTLIEKTDAPQELKNEFIENPQIYTQLSNKATLESAMDILNNNDLNTAIVEYRKMLDAKNPTAIPLGYNISKQLVADGRLDESVQVIRDMSKALTESGQFSQAAAITLMNNDPEAAKHFRLYRSAIHIQ